MANVLNRTTGAASPYRKDYRRSVNTAEYDSADWIINPDLSAVAGFDSIYWIISGDTVSLADESTRNTRDAELAALSDTADKQSQKDAYTDNQLFRAQVKYMVDELNILRQNAGLTPARTYAGAQQFMFDAIDNDEV